MVYDENRISRMGEATVIGWGGSISLSHNVMAVSLCGILYTEISSGHRCAFTPYGYSCNSQRTIRTEIRN